MKSSRTQKHTEKGFTLVELAIVLVIIGLLVGGVLAGQDLIKAAQIRNSQNELLTTNTNANTFRNKYGALPGDIVNSQAVGAGFVSFAGVANVGSFGLRDGNGLIEAPAAASQTVATLGGEVLAFWSDLANTQSGLVAQSIPGLTAQTVNANGFSTVAIAATPAGQANYFNVLKIRNTASLAVGAFNNRNYFIIGTFAAPVDTGVVTTSPVLTSSEASQFDQKFDDGNPRTGATQAITWNGAALAAEAIPAATGAGTCQVNAASDAAAAYNTASTGFNCAIAIRSSF
jgi:prepilin-type N-terminal cleavage/methylation domain-containing protein